jgi:hypothetical protein
MTENRQSRFLGRRGLGARTRRRIWSRRSGRLRWPRSALNLPKPSRVLVAGSRVRSCRGAAAQFFLPPQQQKGHRRNWAALVYAPASGSQSIIADIFELIGSYFPRFCMFLPTSLNILLRRGAGNANGMLNSPAWNWRTISKNTRARSEPAPLTARAPVISFLLR